MSGRIYVAIGQKLKFRANPGNALAYPAGWVSSDPNFPVLHDCAEFTYDGAGMHCNTTMVDMLSVPLEITLTGTQQQRAGRLRDGGRAAVFSALSAQPGFGGLVLSDLRVISPGHGVRAFRKPSTRDVLFRDGALAAPNDGVTEPVAAALGAGFNRGVLTASGAQPVADRGTYYRRAVTNHYSRVMHENTVDGKAYGFAFDDVCDHAPYIEDRAPTAMRVTITPF